MRTTVPVPLLEVLKSFQPTVDDPADQVYQQHQQQRGVTGNATSFMGK
jgi:hypothetical protein